MRYLQLFDEFSESQYSKAFTIFPNSIGVLSAFNLGYKVAREDNEPKNTPQMFIIQKLSFRGGGIFTKEMCGCEGDEDVGLGFDPEYAYAEDVTQCGVWNLNACQNLGAIMLPGTYRVRLNDRGGLGNAILGLVRYNAAESGLVPRKIIFGE
jgi:hypothetical protein